MILISVAIVLRLVIFFLVVVLRDLRAGHRRARRPRRQGLRALPRPHGVLPLRAAEHRCAVRSLPNCVREEGRRDVQWASLLCCVDPVREASAGARG